MRAGLAVAPGATRLLRGASESLAPAFEALVVALLTRPRGRRAGIEALLAGATASTVARCARDAIARPRPGPRSEGGFPSRHAAAAVAIAGAVARHQPRLRPWLVATTVAGLAGRVVNGHHEPGDIAGGALLGWSVDRLVARASR